MKLSFAQWRALFDLYMGALIIETRKSTMAVLDREKLVERTAPHNRWHLSERGREALKEAPREFNPFPSVTIGKPRFDLAEQIRVFGADSLLPDWKPSR